MLHADNNGYDISTKINISYLTDGPGGRGSKRGLVEIYRILRAEFKCQLKSFFTIKQRDLKWL